MLKNFFIRSGFIINSHDSIKPRAIGFAQGQRGDLCISTVAARAFKEQFPGAHLTLGMNKQFADMVDLFKNHEYFDDIHLYEEYDNWPSLEDINYLNNDGHFDIVFSAMPKRGNEHNWWQFEHQALNSATVYGLNPPSSLQCSLTQWFNIPDNGRYVAFSPIGGWYNYPNAKSLSIPRAQEIVDFIISLGYGVIQLGAPDEPKLNGTEKKSLTYIESVRNMLGCKMLIVPDTGLSWVASAYSMPTLGLYSNAYYSSKFIGNIQPKNPNAQYLDDPNVNDINIELIKEKIVELLK